ncbi:unnamed protein product, partial [Ascophyllum nodosum]
IAYVVSDTTTTASSVLHCFSADQATGIHPAEVTSWYCFTDSTSDSVLATTEELSVSCGCSSPTATTTDSATVTTTPTDIVTNATSTTDTSVTPCTAGESFTVVSTIVPEVAGCYSDTGSTNENEVYYSETGTTDAQQNVVGALDLGETGAPDIRWVIGYVVSDTTTTASSVLHCFSADQATG